MKGHLVKRRDQGFTLIEILMVLILIAVLAAVALNSFINFKDDARDAALKSNLAAIRASIAAQYSQMQLRCGTSRGRFPTRDSIWANNVTHSFGTPPDNDCDPVNEVSIASEQAFFQGGVPDNPWSDKDNTPLNDIIDCKTGGGDCIRGNGTNCTGGAFTSHWCYNPDTGEIWSDGPDATREGW